MVQGCTGLPRACVVACALVVCALAACGASDTEIRNARTATYRASPSEIFAIAKQSVTELGYAIAQGDELAWKLVTAPKFFGPEGDSETPGAEGFVHLRDRSVQVQFVVQVIITAEHKAAVLVTPVTFQKLGWSPKPRELAPDDPYLPPFVNGRADAIAVDIHQRARRYAQPGA
jgi:hypothetical protein